MEVQFGQHVYTRARSLAEQGIDANQIAKILCDHDPEGYNYGIGIIVDDNSQPMSTAPTLFDYASVEFEQSHRGTYLNSAAILDQLKVAVLKWQRIPEQYWGQFMLSLPSDAGTGAVKTGLEIILALHPHLRKLGIEELGWPAYKAMAKLSRIHVQEFPADAVIDGNDILPVYQAGPLNTTGLVQAKDVIVTRARAAARQQIPVLLDRAYPGFEYGYLLKTRSYDEMMRLSYEHQLAPFLEQGATLALAISPTKAFVSFALRPCGFLLFYCPEATCLRELTALVNTAIRARGSSFEHPLSRALAKAFINALPHLENDHFLALSRIAEAEALWRKLVAGTSLEHLYSARYAGLFRNPKAREDAPIAIYNEHLYPVFADQRCRLNVTGIPADEDLARQHVQVFAAQCY